MSYVAPLKDMLFNIEHLARIDQVSALPGFEDAGLDTAQAVLEECAKLNEGVIAPLNWEGDKNPSWFNNGQVTTTAGFKDAFNPSYTFTDVGSALEVSLDNSNKEEIFQQGGFPTFAFKGDSTHARGVALTVTGDGSRTGMQALLSASAEVGVIPRILGTPGLETQAVTTALAVVAKKLRAFAYARAIGATVSAATLYRANFSQRELMLLMPDFLAWDTDTSANVTSFAAAHAMGLRAYIDEQTGPQKTLSNVAVDGVVGLSQPMHWDIEDQDTDAGLLNAAQITALIRKSSGFYFWGNRTCSDDPQFVFESGVRVAQLLADTVALPQARTLPAGSAARSLPMFSQGRRAASGLRGAAFLGTAWVTGFLGACWEGVPGVVARTTALPMSVAAISVQQGCTPAA